MKEIRLLILFTIFSLLIGSQRTWASGKVILFELGEIGQIKSFPARSLSDYSYFFTDQGIFKKSSTAI